MAILTTEWQVLSDKQLTGGMFLQTIARYTSQSVSGNYSIVEAQLRIRMGNASNHCYTHSCSFTGGTFDASDSKGSYYHGWEANTTTTILSQSVTIYHDNNGDAAFTIGGTFNNSSGISGSTDSVVCGLPHINRLSVFSIDKPTFNIGETLNLSITKYVNDYRNDLYMLIGNTETFIASYVGSSVQVDTSQYANSLYAQIPNANTYSNVFKLYTISGNTILGSTTQSYTAVVTNSNPTFNVAYQDTNATTTAITSDNQKIIQNKSVFQLNITNATAKNGTSLASVHTEIMGYSSTIPISTATKNISVGTINASSNTTARVTLTDSRGNSTRIDLPVTMLAYSTPSADVYLQRKLNYYSQTDIKVDATYSSLDGDNTITIVYRYKKTTDDDTGWSNYASLTNGTLTTFSVDNRYAWNVQILLQDALETRLIERVLPDGKTPLYVDVFRGSVGVNCFPDRNNTIEIDGKDISNTYSTTEMKVGTWIDGKPIYRKVVDLGEIGTSSTLIPIYLNDGYYDTIVRFDGYKYATGSWCTLNSNTTTESYWMFVDCYTYTGNNLQINIHRSDVNVWYNWNVKVIIEYTKTTD